MDFKSFPKNKKGFDNVFVVIDKLSKQAILIFCYKIITAKGFARLFV
jgi:hypothetical protein